MKIIATTLLFLLFTFLSCSTDEKPTDIFLNAPKGALLANTELGSDNFIISDLESTFDVQLRASDQRKGDFFDFIRVYISLQNNTSNIGNTTDEAVLFDISRSDFFDGEFGFPRIDLTISFQEALDALGLLQNQVGVGDQFYIRIDMHLQDNRIIGFANRSPSIIADFCEDSPFYYQINVVNPIDNDLFTGIYSYELVSSSNIEAVAESGITTITNGEFMNQRRSSFLDFTVAGGLVLPDIYQERGGSCRFGQGIVFWGPQQNSFGVLNNQDDSVFFADFIIGYDGWVGGDLTEEPITARYRFSKQ